MSATIALLVIAIIIILYLYARRQPGVSSLDALREKFNALQAYGQYQEHMIERCQSAPCGNVPIQVQSRLISMAEINRSLNQRCDEIDATIISIDEHNPDERRISIANNALNNIWNMRNDIDMQLVAIDSSIAAK